MTEFWKIVITAVVSALIGVFAYIIKAEFDSKEDVKVSSRLMALDIAKIQKILENNKTFMTPPFNYFSVLSDWRKDFYNVSRRLNFEEAETMLNFYARYQRLTDLQDVYKLIYNDKSKSLEKVTLTSQFNSICKDLSEQDMNNIIKRLESIGA